MQLSILKKTGNAIFSAKARMLFLVFLSVFFLASCCKTCFIARNELTGFHTKKNKVGDKITTVSAGDKTVDFSTFSGGQILLYSVEGDNLISYKSDNKNNCGNYSDFFVKQSDIPLYIRSSRLRLYKPDKIIITSSLDNNFSLTKVMKMNLDNGDIHILEKLSNLGKNSKEVHAQNVLNLKPGGFLILPVSAMSKFKNGFKKFNKTIKSDSYEKYNDLLLVNTNNNVDEIATDSSSGWFAYILKDVLMIVKYPYFYNRNYPYGYTIKAEFKEKLNRLLLFNPNRTVGHNKALYTQYKLIILKLNNSVNSFKQVKKALKNISIPLMLRR
jgi:hypothetical protein